MATTAAPSFPRTAVAWLGLSFLAGLGVFGAGFALHLTEDAALVLASLWAALSLHRGWALAQAAVSSAWKAFIACVFAALATAFGVAGCFLGVFIALANCDGCLS